MALMDRDGVLNVDVGYPHKPEHITWVEGAFEALARLRSAGYRVVVVTNQSGVARGYYSEADVEALHTWMAETVAKRGGAIDAFFHCPYHPEAKLPEYRMEHFDRKPSPGMLLRALSEFATDLDRSFMIGDRETDLVAANAAGVKAFLYAGNGLDALVDQILAEIG